MQVTRISPVQSNFNNNISLRQQNVNFTSGMMTKTPQINKAKTGIVAVLAGIIVSAKAFFAPKREVTEEEQKALRENHVLVLNGRLDKADINYSKVEKLREINQILKNNKPALAKIYLKQDDIKKIPGHYASAEELAVINEGLKEQPKVLAKMYLTKNIKGKTIAHTNDEEKLAEMHKALKDQPETINKIYLTKTKKGRLPIHYADKGAFDFIANELGAQPEIFLEMLKYPNKFKYKGIRKTIAETLEFVSDMYPEKYRKQALELAKIYEK